MSQHSVGGEWLAAPIGTTAEKQLRRRLELALAAGSAHADGESAPLDRASAGRVLVAGAETGILAGDMDVELMVDLLQTALGRQERAASSELRAASALDVLWPLICPPTRQPRLTGDGSLRAANVELQRSNDDLAAFAHVAAHDLSEPLRMVASFMDLLERRYSDSLDERGRRYIWFARDGALRMRQLIDALLAYAEIGAADLQLTTVDTAEVAARVVGDLNPLVVETGATVTIGALPTVTVDAGLLARLLQNLVANAVKFRAPDRPPTVTVDADGDGSGWRFSVTDNGIGIPAEHAERVFGMFTRLHPRSDYAGAGIGLSLCRKIIERHGGVITALRAPSGDGTRVEFWLPDLAVPAARTEHRVSAVTP